VLGLKISVEGASPYAKDDMAGAYHHKAPEKADQ